MPATPYFISAQLALIVTSAVVVKTNLRRESTSAPAPVPAAERQAVPVAVPLEQLALRARAMPAAEIERFAMVEKPGSGGAASDAPGVEARPMGYRSSADEAEKPVGFQREEADSPPERAASSSEEAPPQFAPVPTNAGYHIDADAATNFDLNADTVVFSGHVTLKCADFILKSDRLVVQLDKGKKRSMRRLVANGSVDVHLTGVPEEERYRGQAEEVVFDPNKNTIVFTGWPRIQGQGREHIAASPSTKMTLHTVKPKLETDGRAQTRILYDEKTGMPGLTMGSPAKAE